MSLTATAVEYLRSHPDDFVVQRALLNDISRLSGYSLESVRGTVCKSSSGGLYSVDTQRLTGFRHVPRTEYRAAGFERLNGNPTTVFHDYDCPVKDAVRTKIIDFLDKRTAKRTPRIMTFACHSGYCVKRFLNKWPQARITNIESDPLIFEEYRRLGLKTNDYLGNFYDVDHKGRYDLINYDANAYLSARMARDLEKINEEDLADNVVITLQFSREFRNHGEWVDTMKRKYGHFRDPAKLCVMGLMSNYRFVDEHCYRKTNVQYSRKMRTMFFEKLP